jgi:hypothetical protein
MDLGAPGSMTCPIAQYGPFLVAGKAAVWDACSNSCGGTARECKLAMAMAMIETTLMNVTQRDWTKDSTTDGSANVSLWNLSIDLITSLGFAGVSWTLNTQTHEALAAAACLVVKGVHTWGPRVFLNFVRGGRTAFVDGWSYGAYEYRNAVATILDAFAKDPALLTDGRRVECVVPHV